MSKFITNNVLKKIMKMKTTLFTEMTSEARKHSVSIFQLYLTAFPTTNTVPVRRHLDQRFNNDDTAPSSS